MDLEVFWFVVVAVCWSAYFVLEGFDFGVGMLLPFLPRGAHGEEDRRTMFQAIGPVWDGNEVWLLAAGGALFAAFPPVYATVFSGFYIALMLLLVALIGRAVAIEFRGKVESPTWRRAWDWVFMIGSALPPLLLGVALGNVMRGLPIGADGEYQGTFLSLLNPYAVLIGLLTMVLFALHGALYLQSKTDGSMRTRLQQWIIPLWCAFAVLHLLAAAATAWFSADLYSGIHLRPLFWMLSVLWLAGIVSVPAFAASKKFTLAFAGSALTVATMVGLVGVALFPRLVPSSLGSGLSLTIDNSSSSPQTLKTMLIIALTGMPLVIAYTAIIYRVFRGKVVLTEDSY